MKTLKNYWEKWKNLAERIGNFQASVIFSLLYFILITPIGMISGLITDYLKRGVPGWDSFEGNSDNIDSLKEQA